jgi:hypothetical protein
MLIFYQLLLAASMADGFGVITARKFGLQSNFGEM